MEGSGHVLNQAKLAGGGRAQDLFDELRNSQTRYHEACHAFARASEEKMTAEKILADVSAKAQQVIHVAMQDPTMPQPAECPPPMNPGNGRW